MSGYLTVCLITYRNARGLETFLGTLTHYSHHSGKVIVWDNNEDENEQKSVRNLLKRYYPGKARIMGCGLNLFGDACVVSGRYPLQEALAVVDTPFVAFMQDDMAFPPNSQMFWNNMMDTAWYKEVGLVAPCSDGLYEGQQMNRVDLPCRFEANHVHGNALVARTELLRELGGWDGRMFWGIDTEMCLRVRMSGYKIIVDRRSFVLHRPAGTLGKAETDLGEKIVWWGESGRNLVLQMYGVENYYRYILCGGHDVNSAMLVHGWSWKSLSAELVRRVPEWIPQTT